MKRNRTSAGIAAVVLVIILVIIVAAVGAGSYFLLFKNGLKTPAAPPPTATGSSSSTNTGQVISSSQSSSQSSSSSAPFDTSGLLQSMNDLLGNFSQMTVQFSDTSTTTTSNSPPITISYVVLGHYVINSTQLTAANFTSNDGSGQDNSSAILWFDPQGNATMVTTGGANYTGTFAQVYAYAFSFYFTLFFGDASNLANSYSQLTNAVNQGSQSFGSTQLNVVSYTWNYFGGESATLQVGNLPGTSLYLVTKWEITGGGSGGSWQVISLTKA